MRNPNGTLLNAAQEKLFTTRGRRMLRWIAKPRPDARRRGRTDEEPVELTSEILAVTAAEIRKNRRWSRALCIEVHENDGMTWSAETARRALHEKYGRFDMHVLHDEPSTDRIPAVADIIGLGRFMSTAVRNHLADDYPLRSWRTLVIGALLVFAPFVKQVVDVVVRNTAASPSAAGVTLNVILLLLASAIVGVAATWWTANKPVVSRRKSEENFRRLPAIEKMEEYDGFIDDLAKQLCRMREPRFVVVDHYQSLDQISQAVIERYFEEYHEQGTQSELWVVFEGPGGDRLSVVAENQAANPAFLPTTSYEQLYLTEDKRKTLAEVAGDPARAVFLPVKSICMKETDDDWVAKLLEPMPQESATVRYFHLLAMESVDLGPERRASAAAANCFFSWQWLGDADRTNSAALALEGLSTEASGIRPAIIAAAVGRTLNKSDIASIEREISQRLSSLLVKSERDPRFFAIAREAAIYLYDHAAERSLPDPSIAKLFWAFTLSQKKNTSRAFWARRVVRHLLEIDVARVPDALKTSVIMTELRNLVLNMIDAALRCCLFDDVPDLIRMARLLISDYDRQPEPSWKRLRRYAWQAYHLTGSEEILSQLIAAMGGADEERDVARPALPALARVFSQAVPMEPMTRTMLEALLLADDARRDPEAYDYALARASWLTLLAVPFFLGSTKNPKAFGIFDASEVRATVNAILERTMQRLSAPKREEVSTVDVATLSLAMWCRALMFEWQFLRAFPPPGAAIAALWSNPGLQETELRTVAAGFEDFADLVNTSMNAVIVACGYLTEARRRGASHFLATAMVHETCAMALASLWVARVHLTHSNFAVAAANEQLTRILRDVDATIGTSMAEVADAFASENVRGTVEDLLRVVSMVWRRFGLTRMSEFTAIRYVHFSFASTRAEPSDDRRRPLVSAIEPFIREQHFSGLAAGLTLATCQRESSELASIHLVQTAVIAAEMLTGEELQEGLALLAVLNGRAALDELTPLLRNLLQAKGGGDSAIRKFLAAVEDDMLQSATLDLMNASHHSDDRAIRAQMANEIRKRAATAGDAALREEIEAMLDLDAVRLEIRDKRADAAALLRQWETRRHLWPYPTLLSELRNYGGDRTALDQEALQLLDRDPDRDAINSWYHLAIHVADDLADEGENTAIAYVRAVVERFEDIEIAEVNIDAYRLLMRRDRNDGRWARGALRWQKVKLARDIAAKFPALLARRKFFLLFVEHFEHMRVWGLPLDIPFGDFRRREQTAMERPAECVEAWFRDGAKVPQPVVISEGRLAVCAEFLLLGTCVFDRACECDPRLDSIRNELNSLALNATPRLISEVTVLNVPQEVRAMLHEFTDSYAQPALRAV